MRLNETYYYFSVQKAMQLLRHNHYEVRIFMFQVTEESIELKFKIMFKEEMEVNAIDKSFWEEMIAYICI
jgi:hypothetical protein